jgi:2-polyprenyl-3-methyl-5-hydroxy-6-metoxy-1,4-benzoquinol methylase
MTPEAHTSDKGLEVFLCPLCRRSGRAIRRREAAELAGSYRSYLNTALPPDLVQRYFRSAVTEFFCENCGFRYYGPSLLGDGDYYYALANLFPWYYNPKTWDKGVALDYVASLGNVRVVEVGCGPGDFLESLRQHNIECMGIDLNGKAVATATRKGLAAYLPGEQPKVDCDVLCMFQTIEHVENPVDFLAAYVRQFEPGVILLSAPCFESLLGYTSDPLSWPPHHATAWSAKAFGVLAEALGRRLDRVWYESGNLSYYRQRHQWEVGGKIPGLPRLPANIFGRVMFRLLRCWGFDWANRSHSIMASIC